MLLVQKSNTETKIESLEILVQSAKSYQRIRRTNSRENLITKSLPTDSTKQRNIKKTYHIEHL